MGGKTVSCLTWVYYESSITHRKQYHDIKNQWYGVEEVFDRSDILEVRLDFLVICMATDLSLRSGIGST